MRAFVQAQVWTLVATYSDIASGKNDRRSGFQAALRGEEPEPHAAIARALTKRGVPTPGGRGGLDAHHGGAAAGANGGADWHRHRSGQRDGQIVSLVAAASPCHRNCPNDHDRGPPIRTQTSFATSGLRQRHPDSTWICPAAGSAYAAEAHLPTIHRPPPPARLA